MTFLSGTRRTIRVCLDTPWRQRYIRESFSCAGEVEFQAPNARIAGSMGHGTMVQFMKGSRLFVFILADAVAVLAANLMAVLLRFDFDWSHIAVRENRLLELIALDLLLTPVIFYATGLYQGYWKYASLVDLLRLARAVAYRTTALIVLFYALGFFGLSRAVLIMNTVLLLVFAGMSRLAPRFHFEFSSSRQRSSGLRTLIIGAGDTGESLLRELK